MGVRTGVGLAVVGLALFSGCSPLEQKGSRPTPAPADTAAAPPPTPQQTSRPPELPAFEWPPPRYSAFVEVPREWIAAESATLGSVARHLEYAFDSAGYGERSYFWIPGGFALASRIEQIRVDATSLAPPDRWAITMTRPPQGFLDFVRALFDARPGLYRVIVFAVTDASLSAGKRTPTPGEATEWIYGGLAQLPASVGAMEYSNGHHTTALVYEFERKAEADKIRVTTPSHWPGRIHLERSGLLQALTPR